MHYEGLKPAAAMMLSDMRSHVQFSVRRNASTFIASANKLPELQYCTVPSIRPIKVHGSVEADIHTNLISAL